MTSFNDDWLAAILGPLLPPGGLERIRTGNESKTTLWERLLDARLLPESEVLAALSSRCRLPIAELSDATTAARDALPAGLARRYGVVPLRVNESLLEVATANPFDVGAEQALAFATGREVRMALASPPRIRETLDLIYGPEEPEHHVADLLQGMQGGSLTEVSDEEEEDAALLVSEASSRPIIKLVNV